MDGAGRLAKGVSARLTADQGRRFGFTLGFAFAALGGLLWWRSRDLAAAVSGSVGALLVLGALAVPTKLEPVERLWMALAHALSKVMMPIVMASVYFLVVMPIGLAMRLFGRNPLVRTASGGGYWVSRQEERARRGGMRRQF